MDTANRRPSKLSDSRGLEESSDDIAQGMAANCSTDGNLYLSPPCSDDTVLSGYGLTKLGYGVVKAVYPPQGIAELEVHVVRSPEAARIISLIAPGGCFEVFVRPKK